MKKYCIVLCLLFLTLVSAKNSNSGTIEDIAKNLKKYDVNNTAENFKNEDLATLIDDSLGNNTAENIEEEDYNTARSLQNTNIYYTNDSGIVLQEELSMANILQRIEAEKTEVKALLAEIKTYVDRLEAVKKDVSDYVLSDIKTKGLYLGNRWRIAEEGTGTYEALVFRDMTTTLKGTDRRYAFFKERYTDL